MIKLSGLLIAVVLFLSGLSLGVSGFDEALFEEQLEASGAENLIDKLPDETVELLDALGIDRLEFDSVFSADLRQVFGLLYKIVRNEYSSAFSYFPQLAGLLILVAAFSSILGADNDSSAVVRMASCAAIALSVIVPLSQCITRAISSLHATGNFMLFLVPVLAAVITAAGNPVLAISYNSLSLLVAQLVCAMSDSVVRPLIQTILSMGVISSVTQTVYLFRLTDFIKKSVVFLLSFSATVFITMLTIKGALSVSVDNVAVRGIRFVIGNIIPVVGGAVSDAYTSVLGTLSLVKNTVAVFGLAAVALVNIPTLVECVIWIFMLNILGVLSDVFGSGDTASLFRGLSSGITLLSVVILLEMLLFLLSTGLIITVWSG